MNDPYDLIVIGSGMGGLTVASLAARLASLRVLLLERHFKLGGFTHDFRRGRFRWDVGLHYVGEMGPGAPGRRLMDLVTGREVEWTRMPDPVDRFVYPTFTFDVPVGRRACRDALCAAFPEERAGIDRYFRRVRRAAAGLGAGVLRRNASPGLRVLARAAGQLCPAPGGLTTKEVLEEVVGSRELRALLASLWGAYGLPPRLSAFAIHAVVVRHYLEGGWYPVGGAGRIAAAARRAVEAAGGTAQVCREVDAILVEGGRAVGVRTHSTAAAGGARVEEHRAPAIVSDAGAATTWGRLVPEAHAEPHRSVLADFLARHPAATSVVLYLGLSDSPASLGLRGENHWIFDDLDHDAAFERRRAWLRSGTPPCIYLSFPSLKDPEARAHTAEAMTFCVDYDDFARWRHAPWRRRGPEYDALKKSLSDRILSAVERHLPGFTALVAHAELSTPVTNEHFTNHPRGRVYGLPAVPELYGGAVARATRPRTDLPGLYLTGADTGLHGILGALADGVTTLGHVPGGPSLVRVFRAAARTARVR